MKKSILAACVLISALSGCFGAQTVNPTRYYPVEPAIRVDSAETATAISLGVRPLAAARPYRMPVAYLDESGFMQFRSNDSWAELPSDTVTRALLDALRQTGRFEDVGDAADMSRPQLLLTGELRKFHELRDGQTSQAEVELRIEVREVRDAHLIWADTLNERQAFTSNNMTEMAEAMAQAVGRAVSRAANAIAAAPLP